MPHPLTLDRVYSLGFEAYYDEHECPWTKPTRVHVELEHQWTLGYRAAEKDARLERRHERSLRAGA